MHSRIYQVSEKPILEENFLTPNDYTFEDAFYHRADYISEINKSDYAEDAAWLMNTLDQYGVIYDANLKQLVFPVDFKKHYAAEQFKTFQALVPQLTANDFGNYYSSNRYKLERLIADLYGFQINCDGTHYTLQDWLLLMPDDQENIFYLGNILDYHF